MPLATTNQQKIPNTKGKIQVILEFDSKERVFDNLLYYLKLIDKKRSIRFADCRSIHSMILAAFGKSLCR